MNRPAAETPTGFDSSRAKRVLAVTCAATSMTFVDLTIVNTAFPDISRSFPAARLGDLSWIINAYAVLFAALLMPAGRIADIVGRRRVFLAGVALFTAASAACAAAPSLETLVIARAFQGIAAAMLIPTSIALVLPEFAPERVPLALGIWGASNSVAAAFGPALGGLLVELADWRLVFLINLPIGALALALGLRTLRESRDESARRLPDAAGTVALTAGVALVFLSIVKGHDWGWLSQSALGTFAAGLVLAAVALRRSFSHPVPVVELTLWKIPGMAAVNAASILAGAAMFSFILAGSLFLTSVWGYSVLDAGLAMTTGAGASAIASPVSGRLIARFGERPVLITGSLVFALTALIAAIALPRDPHFLTYWLPVGTGVGIGFGFVFPALSSAAAAITPPAKFASGMGLNMTARQIGGGLGIAVLVALLETESRPLIDRFSYAWLLCAATSAGVAIAAAGVAPRRRPAPDIADMDSSLPPNPAVAPAPAKAAM